MAALDGAYLLDREQSPGSSGIFPNKAITRVYNVGFDPKGSHTAPADCPYFFVFNAEAHA
jgi:hypothetical protein